MVKLADLEKELAKGRIYEAQIVGSPDHVEGLCNWERGDITVNPSASVVDTLIHELIHRRFPSYSEDRVLRETSRVMARLSHADVAVWYRKYKRLVKRKTKPVKLRSAELQG